MQNSTPKNSSWRRPAKNGVPSSKCKRKQRVPRGSESAPSTPRWSRVSARERRRCGLSIWGANNFPGIGHCGRSQTPAGPRISPELLRTHRGLQKGNPSAALEESPRLVKSGRRQDDAWTVKRVSVCGCAPPNKKTPSFAQAHPLSLSGNSRTSRQAPTPGGSLLGRKWRRTRERKRGI